MSRRLMCSLWLLILVVAAFPVRAAESALDAISTDASVVIRLKNPKASIAKIADLADLVQKGFGEHIRSAPVGQAISNPQLTGVDMESDWWVAVFATGGEKDPDVVFLIPGTDLKAMKEAIGDGYKFMESGKLGIYTTDSDAAGKIGARLKGEGKSISTLIEKDSNSVFDKGDVSVFINVVQLAAAYKSEIADWKQKVQEQLENADEIPGAAPGMDPKKLADMLGQAFGFLVQGLDDTLTCTVAAMVSKEGLAFDDLVKLKAGTATDKLLSKSPPTALQALSTLPSGYQTYWGLSWDMTDFTKFNEWMLAFGGESEKSKEVAAFLKEIGSLKIGSTVGAYGLGDPDEGAIRSIAVTEVDSPQKMRDMSRKMLKSLGTVEAQGMKQTIELKADAEKIGKNSADIVTVNVEIENPQMAMMMQNFMNVLFGPEGMQTRIVYLKDRVVQTMGGGTQVMTDTLAALDKKPSDNSKSPMQQTRAKLGEKANLVFMLDVPNLIAKILSIVVERAGLPLPIQPEDIKGLQGKPSYLALAAATEPQGLRVKTQVPLEQMQGIAKFVDFVQTLFQGMGGGIGLPAGEDEEN